MAKEKAWRPGRDYKAGPIGHVLFKTAVHERSFFNTDATMRGD